MPDIQYRYRLFINKIFVTNKFKKKKKNSFARVFCFNDGIVSLPILLVSSGI